jgi:tRNA 2-thiouridine synthesizing protein A
MIAPTLELDLKGLSCPMPLLKTKQALNKLNKGAVIKVIATDPASVRDFQVFAEQSGNRLLASEQQDGCYLYLIEKQ